MTDLYIVRADVVFPLGKHTEEEVRLFIPTTLAQLVFDVYHAEPKETYKLHGELKKTHKDMTAREAFTRYHRKHGWTRTIPLLRQGEHAEFEEVTDALPFEDELLGDEGGVMTARKILDYPHAFYWKRVDTDGKNRFVHGQLFKHVGKNPASHNRLEGRVIFQTEYRLTGSLHRPSFEDGEILPAISRKIGLVSQRYRIALSSVSENLQANIIFTENGEAARLPALTPVRAQKKK